MSRRITLKVKGSPVVTRGFTFDVGEYHFKRSSKQYRFLKEALEARGEKVIEKLFGYEEDTPKKVPAGLTTDKLPRSKSKDEEEIEFFEEEPKKKAPAKKKTPTKKKAPAKKKAKKSSK